MPYKIKMYKSRYGNWIDAESSLNNEEHMGFKVVTSWVELVDKETRLHVLLHKDE